MIQYSHRNKAVKFRIYQSVEFKCKSFRTHILHILWLYYPIVSVVEHAVFQLNPHPPGGGSLRRRLRMSDYQTRG